MNEAMKFESCEDANYFSECYKDVAPMMRNFEDGGQPPVIDRHGRTHSGNSGYIPKAQTGATYNFPVGMIPTASDTLLYNDYVRRQKNTDPHMHKRAEGRLYELETGYDAYKKTDPTKEAWNQYLMELNARRQGALEYVPPPLSPKKKRDGGWLEQYQDRGEYKWDPSAIKTRCR